MKVINLFAGPGAGKTTTAAGVFHRIKEDGRLICEFVPEYAKELAWENNGEKLKDQLYVTAKQHRGLVRLEGKVDVAITDSPLLLSLCYAPEDYPKTFAPLVLDLHNKYDNLNFFIRRGKHYSESGRMQTEEEAEKLDSLILDTLYEHGVPYCAVESKRAVDAITEHLLSLLTGGVNE